MDFLKKFLANVLPVNQIIKFIIKQFLSSYLVIKENDLEEKPSENSGLKNLININDLELNVSNINHEHLLHSPIKLLKGKLGRFSLDITDANKIIITIEDVSIDLMPLFNYYKKYQETIFNMEKTKEKVQIESEKENKNMAGGIEDPNKQKNPKNQNNYMLNMANKLLTNLEINVKNISVKLFTYEISEKIPENPVFSLFIMNVNIYKDEKNKKKESIIDPNTNQEFEDTFLNNLVIEVDKLCIKVDQNKNNKDNMEFKEIRKFCNNKNLTKEQEERILGFFIAYNTIFAMNYKKGSCLRLKLHTKPRIVKYKEIEEEKKVEKKKIIEDMNIEIDIFEAESIITPHQLFNIQILYQISNFIFTLNKNTSSKEKEEKENEKKFKINKIPENNDKEKEKEKEKDKENEENIPSSSGIFNKNKNNDNDKNDFSNLDNNLKMSFMLNNNKEENKKEEKDEKKKDILGHEISKINLTMNAKRIILVILENNNNESIPKLFSFLMEDEIKNKTKNKKVENSTLLNFDKSNESFENYYCYFEDNLLFLKIENITSINTEENTSISVSSLITEYIRDASKQANINDNKEKTNLKMDKNSSIEASIYDSFGDFEDFKEAGDDEDMFQSAIENTELLIMENYNKYINKFLAGEYQSNKFEILKINELKFNMTENTLDIKEILVNLNYIIILLYIKLFTQINYFIKTNNPMFTNEDIIPSNEIEENLNVNLEKKINDSELQLFKNLSKVYKNNSNESGNNAPEDLDISLNESIDYSEEEQNKKNGMKININYISIKIYNVAKNIKRFDTNIYFYKLFLELVYPNITKKLNPNKYEYIEQQSFNDLVSKDFMEIVLNNMNMVYYKITSISKINIVFQEILFKYWNYIVIQYNNMNKKNNIEENPNVLLSMPDMDIVVDFSEKVKINLEKNILDDLLNFNNTFLYGLSMYQIFDKYCGDLYNNKLLNLFDLFGLKNHFQLLKNMNTEDDNQRKIEEQNSSKINKNKKEIQEIKEKLDKKPNMSIGGRIISCVININKNGTFDEKEGNLIKIKMVNLGVNLEMFSDDNKNKEPKEPVYNNLSISINNIYFLIKEYPIPKEGKPKYYNLFSKNKTQKFDSTDYFILSFKFRNIKKIRDDIIIEEENEESDTEKEDQPLKKKNSKFEVSNSKISLEKKTTDYIAFLLDNQVKLDNMEMVIDIKLSEIIFDSFYHKLDVLSSTLSDFYIEFTSKKGEPKENLEGTYLRPQDLIPLCEDRLMIIKCDFNINHFLIDIFLKEDKDQKNWMRLLFMLEKFKFTFNENGMFLNLDNNYIYIMKDFNYIYHMPANMNNNNFFEIEDKINDIHREDSYLKRLGYVELFYNDQIKLYKLEKELNLNLGNINIFFCQDSFSFLLDFTNVFMENYLNKIKDIFAQDSLNSDNDSSEEIEKNIIKKENEKEKEKEKNDLSHDFEEIDDIFFMEGKKGENIKDKNKKNKYIKINKNSLETIPEEKHKSKNKDSTVIYNFDDDFTIIETKSSLERKQIKEIKEENCEKYILQLNSFRLYLFSGYDFNFQDDTKKDLDLSSEQNPDININNENDNINLDIDTNYFFKLTFKNDDNSSKKILRVNKRIKTEVRDYKNYILITILNLSFKIIDFCFFDFIIDNFFIDDNFEKSLYKKIISKQDYANETSKFLICNIDFNKNEEVNKANDVSFLKINIILPSLDIFVDQLPLNFLIKLILSQNYDKNEENDCNSNDEEKNSCEKNKKGNNNGNKNDSEKKKLDDSWEDGEKLVKEYKNESLIYVNDISINLFTINFHYNSHKISFKKFISNGDWLELLTGLTDVKDLNLKFKKFKKNTQTSLSDIISEIIEFWKGDILNNQITDSVLRGFTLTRPFFKLYDGVKDLVWQPYLAYKENEGIKRGLKKGVKSFLFSFSSQGIFFGEKIFRGMKIVAFRKTKLTLKKKSLYKAWVYRINKKQHDYEMHYYK